MQVGIPTFGPSQLAARMEGSKAFSKAFMLRHNIPTATFRTFSSSQVDEAIEHVRTCGYRVVLKASGLAAGKGVLIPESTDEAVDGLRQIMVANVFGAAGPLLYLLTFDFSIINPPTRTTFQGTKSLSRNYLKALRYPSSHSLMVTQSFPFLLPKTTNVLVRATRG